MADIVTDQNTVISEIRHFWGLMFTVNHLLEVDFELL